MISPSASPGRPFRLSLRLLLVASVLLLVWAAPTLGGSKEQKGKHGGLWQRTKRKVGSIIDDGRFDLLLSGYAHHGRSTYTPQRIAELNEAAWGGGIGKTLVNSSGDDESLYLLAFSDSHFKPEVHLGYSYRFKWSIYDSPLELGLGFTAFLMSRVDWADGFPYPGLLPLASLGTRAIEAVASYIPPLGKTKGNGDVLIVFLRVSFD
ncbi:MAG: hypothetical protein HY815_30610 [Candidatus Riflebacteria bacterium]|nr:hypothetical protein [Candidatus Riflebacteria bacterium]